MSDFKQALRGRLADIAAWLRHPTWPKTRQEAFGLTVRLGLGGVMAGVGLILAVLGLKLLLLGGSAYYVLAGLAILISGIMIALGLMLGAWVYIATFGVTLLWSFWESGLNGWALIPRLALPAVFLVLILHILPILSAEKGFKLRNYGLMGMGGLLALILVGVGLSSHVQVLAPTAELDRSGYDANQPAGKDWPKYGGSDSAQRYSTLTQITPENVKGLKRAWVYRTGEKPQERYAPETTPLKIGDRLYGCTGLNGLYALDARNGKAIWTYDPQTSAKSVPYMAVCRGVTYYKVPGAAKGAVCAERIIEGTLDARLITVDAQTGKPCTGFGKGGAVDLTIGLGKVFPKMVAVTSPPVIVRGIIVTGHQVHDNQYRFAPSGVIRGYDAVTGKLRFAWDVMRPETKTTPPPGETYTPGTPNSWSLANTDEALGLVYLPMGNSGADYYSSTRRPLEKTVSSSMVALDVMTGKPRWVFQTVHNDVWDYDVSSQPTLIEFPTPKGKVPAMIFGTKQGDIYVLDRRTGKPLTQVVERPAPQGGVEPQDRSPTQPVSLYANLRSPDIKEKDMWGLTPFDQLFCRIRFRKADYLGPYTPPTTHKPWIQYPGFNGGIDWGSQSVDPQRGIAVFNYNDFPIYNRLLPRKEAEAQGMFPIGDPRAKHVSDVQVGVPYAVDINAAFMVDQTRMPCKQPPMGSIRAIDLATGKTLWDRPFGSARNNGPFNERSRLPVTVGTPNNGGSVITKGGLIFIGAATDGLFRAIDVRTGKTLWTDVMPTSGQATPMVYEQDGRQYVVIMAGGHAMMMTKPGDYLIAYALPDKK